MSRRLHPIVRTLANVEAVIDQLFPATLLSRLITLELRGYRQLLKETGGELIPIDAISGENQTEDSGPNGRNLRPTVDPAGSIRLILSISSAISLGSQLNTILTRCDEGWDPEYELLDTGIFNEDRYFDVFVEYAKTSPTDLLIEISVCNRGPDESVIHVLPTFWFRNTWAWWPEEQEPSLKDQSKGNRVAGRGILALVNEDRLRRILSRMLDEPPYPVKAGRLR
jgi:hypothetical protein